MPDAAMVVYSDSAEVLEQRFPMRVNHIRLLTDSGGAGQFRGAPATEVAFGPIDTDMTVYYFADFAQHPALGVLGGQPGSAVTLSRLDADGTATALDPIGDTTLTAGDMVIGSEAGGGGYGDPYLRDPALVLDDVVEGWVSPEAAASDYGVALVSDAHGSFIHRRRRYQSSSHQVVHRRNICVSSSHPLNEFAMTATKPTTPKHDSAEPDEHHLSHFGYKQELSRALGKFSSFAVSFSGVGISAGIFITLPVIWASSGTLGIWSWLPSSVGALLVGLIFADLVGRLPIAGYAYQWSTRLSNKTLAG